MGKETESADLIMKLYDLRREATMREARSWFVGSFFPTSAQDIINTMIAPETSAFYRMVVSYWDMAAGFVNRGAIDEQMFMDSGGESIVVFSKIEPYLQEVRTIMASPKMLVNLENLIMRMPEAKELLASRRDMIERMIAARSQLTKGG